MQLEKVRYTAKARDAVGFGLLSRLLVVLFAATTPLALSAALPDSYGCDNVRE